VAYATWRKPHEDDWAKACRPKLERSESEGGRFVHYVYLIRSSEFPERTYIGFTADLKKRMATHNSGGSKHTAQYRPWALVSYHTFADEQTARAFEHYLKTGSGQAFAKKRLW
jgi:putative endonuclease